MNSATITVGFEFSPSNPDAFPGMTGGLRVSVGELVVTRVSGHSSDSSSGPYDARGEELDSDSTEFIGEYVDAMIDDLQDVIGLFLNDAADRYREYVVTVRGPSLTREILFSYVDREYVRIAATTAHVSDLDHAPLDAKVGAPVEPTAFAEELIDCRREMVTYVERAFGDSWRDFSEEIETYRKYQEEHIAELQALLE